MCNFPSTILGSLSTLKSFLRNNGREQMSDELDVPLHPGFLPRGACNSWNHLRPILPQLIRHLFRNEPPFTIGSKVVWWAGPTQPATLQHLPESFRRMPFQRLDDYVISCDIHHCHHPPRVPLTIMDLKLVNKYPLIKFQIVMWHPAWA